MRTFVIGDIHGADKALVQCLERARFDYGRDRLIALGDICDGYPGVRQCIDELLKIKHCDVITGNHDLWALAWATRGEAPQVWVTQGGERTIASYGGGPMPKSHVDFLKGAHLWIEQDNKLFVHGGIDWRKPVDQQDVETLTWDRNLVVNAWNMAHQNPAYKFSTYDTIFVGHTTTQWLARNPDALAVKPVPAEDIGTKPLFLCNVVMMDTGAGWSGKLTIMDIESREYWQSDPTPILQGTHGRR